MKCRIVAKQPDPYQTHRVWKQTYKAQHVKLLYTFVQMFVTYWYIYKCIHIGDCLMKVELLQKDAESPIGFRCLATDFDT